jgi:hypothetical protein
MTDEQERCEAFLVVSPTASDEERRCPANAGAWVFETSLGRRLLCESHAKSYHAVGFILVPREETR